jgi:tetratricopeptide (TPR) repeat protein
MWKGPHRPIVLTRGPEDPGPSYSLLAGEMTRRSANSHEMERFYLLQKDFSRAIPYLVMAEGEIGTSAAVHNDLGVAYLENGSAAETEKAGAEFRHAVEKDPSFEAAAFNLALFYERKNEIAQATAQWKRFLELDSESGWASEARDRLQGLSR